MLAELFAQNSPTLEIGSIGWEGEDDYFFPGTTEDDGHTLVRVQLFRGRDATTPLNPDRAQGVKLICHVPDGTFRIPKKDARCYVAIPAGMDNTPGAGLIVATVGGGLEVNRNITEGDAVMSPTGGGQAAVLTKGNGSITLHTTADNTQTGASVFFQVSPTALRFMAPWGKFVFDASGFHVKTASGAAIDMGGISIPLLPDAIAGAFSSYVKITAATTKVNSGSIFLGAGALFQPVVTGGDILPAAVPGVYTPPPAVPQPGQLKQSQTIYVAA